jgi:hypothetical protein
MGVWECGSMRNDKVVTTGTIPQLFVSSTLLLPHPHTPILFRYSLYCGSREPARNMARLVLR